MHVRRAAIAAIYDIAAFVGVCFIAVGLYQIHRSLCWIWLGMVLLCGAVRVAFIHSRST